MSDNTSRAGTYVMPAASCRVETEVKKSRFICQIFPCEDKAQAKSLLHTVRTAIPESNHHCWAYQLGPANALMQACSDDGEPHGTAGKPMLNVIAHAGLTNALVVVSRIFGGTKLGTGGLVRAYSQAVNAGLDVLQTTDFIVWQNLHIQMTYAQENQVRRLLDEHGFQMDACQHTEDVMITGRISKQDADLLIVGLSHLTLGVKRVD